MNCVLPIRIAESRSIGSATSASTKPRPWLMLLAISSRTETEGSSLMPGHCTPLSMVRRRDHLWQRREAVQRVTVERVSLPRRLVPHAVLVADDLDRHDHYIGAELVCRSNAVIKLPARLDGKFDRPRKLVVPEKF